MATDRSRASNDLIVISDENERKLPPRKQSVQTRSSSSSSSTLPLKEVRRHVPIVPSLSREPNKSTTATTRRSKRTQSKPISTPSVEPPSSTTTTTTTTTSSTTSSSTSNNDDQKYESPTEPYPTNKTRSKRAIAEEKSLMRKRPHLEEKPTEKRELFGEFQTNSSSTTTTSSSSGPSSIFSSPAVATSQPLRNRLARSTAAALTQPPRRTLQTSSTSSLSFLPYLDFEELNHMTDINDVIEDVDSDSDDDSDAPLSPSEYITSLSLGLLPEEASLIIPDLSSDEALARALAREEEALISAMALPPHPTNYYVPPILSTPPVSSNTRRSGSSSVNTNNSNSASQPQSQNSVAHSRQGSSTNPLYYPLMPPMPYVPYHGSGFPSTSSASSFHNRHTAAPPQRATRSRSSSFSSSHPVSGASSHHPHHLHHSQHNQQHQHQHQQQQHQQHYHQQHYHQHHHPPHSQHVMQHHRNLPSFRPFYPMHPLNLILERAANSSHLNLNLIRLGLIDRDFDENDYEMLLALDDEVTKGASEESINRLPTQTLTEVAKEEKCCICLCEMDAGVEVKRLPCTHYFHVECIDTWLKVNKCCPIDKKEIPA